MGVAHRVLQLHLLADLEQRSGVLDDLGVEGVGHLVAALDGADPRAAASVGDRQDRVEVEVVEVRGAAVDLCQEVGAADDLIERAGPQGGQDLAHFLGDEAEQVDHLFRRAGELLPKRRVLGADPHRTGVRVALAHHDAAHGHQRGGADTELLGAQHGGDHHVAAGLDAAVGAQRHVVAQAVQGQHLLGLGQAHLPGHAGVLDRGLRRGAGAARVPRDQDHVGLGLGDAGGDRADARARHQLDADPGLRVDLLQVVDQLRQVLDRVDVVVRRRRDQGHPGHRAAQGGDLIGDLEARDLAALAGLAALGHLDLELAGGAQIARRHPEAARGDLADGARPPVAGRRLPAAEKRRPPVFGVGLVAFLGLAAFARVAAPTDPVHGHRQGLVGLARHRPVAHRRGAEAAGDLRRRLHLVELEGPPGPAPGEQIAQLRERTLVAELGVGAESLAAAGAHRLVQRLEHRRVEVVVLAVLAEAEQPVVGDLRVLAEGLAVADEDVAAEAAEADAAHPAGGAGEAGVQ